MRPLPPPSTLFPYTTLFRSTRSLFLTVNNNVETASALEQTIISRRSALDATRAGYDVGTRNIVEVLDAERAYYVALRDYANARYDYVINTLQLKQAAGTLSPQDLIDLNNWLSEGAQIGRASGRGRG